MLFYLVLFLLSFFPSLFLTPIMRALGSKIRIIDRPGELSIHAQPIPRIGGLAIVISFLVAVSLGFVFSGPFGLGWKHQLWGVLAGGVLIFIVGFFDDVKQLPARTKFLGQLLAAAVVVFSGLKVGVFPLVYVSVFLTIFYLVGGANAMNLMDGMDGLAAGLSSIASFFFAIISIIQTNTIGVILSVALLGASLGFLPHNFPRARIFMGDSGSLFLGFILASLAILFTSKPYNFVWLIIPILIFGLPVVDTSLAIVRRVVWRQNIFSGDRKHIYDQLMDQGLSQKQTVFVCYGLGFLFGTTALLLQFIPFVIGGPLIAVEMLGLVGMVWKLNLLRL